MFAQTLNSTEASTLDQGKPLSDAPSQAYSATTLSHCISPRPSGATDCTAASDLCNTTPGPRETRAPRPALIYARSFRKKRMLRSSFARRVPATSIVRNFFRASLERSTNSACLLFSSGFDVQLRFVFERLLFLAPGRTEHSLVRQPLLRLLAVADRKYGIETWLENVRPRILIGIDETLCQEVDQHIIDFASLMFLDVAGDAHDLRTCNRRIIAGANVVR